MGPLTALLNLAISAAGLLYSVFKMLPLRDKVVFVSRQANTPSRDFRLLAEELSRRCPGLELRFLCRTMGESPLQYITYTAEMVRLMYHLASSRVCFVDGYAIPVSILNHRDQLLVIQTWHALGAIKKFGYQSLDRPGGRPSRLARAMKMHRNYDVILCGSRAMIPAFAEAFDADPSTVLPIGLPRADYLSSRAAKPVTTPAVRRLIQAHPRLTDRTKRVILYAPTHRARSHSPLKQIIEAVDPSRHTLVIKPHDLSPQCTVDGHVVDASDVNVLDLLPIVDAVVTDYSAVAFEACILEVPLYFYVPDADKYDREQGLNLNPLEIVPQAASRDILDLLGLIDSGVGGAAASKLFRERYISFAPGRCTSDITDLATRHLTKLEEHDLSKAEAQA